MYLKKKEILSIILGLLISINTHKIFASDADFPEESGAKKVNSLNSCLEDTVIFPDDFPKKPEVDVDFLTKIQRQAVKALSKDTVGLHRSAYCQEKFTVFLEARNQILEQIAKLGVYTITLQTDPVLKKTDPKIATYHYEIQNISKENIGQFWLTILEVDFDKDKKVPKLSEAQKRQWTSYNTRLKSIISDEPTTLRGALIPFEAMAFLGRTAASQRAGSLQEEEVETTGQKVLTSPNHSPAINIKASFSASASQEETSSSKKVKKETTDSQKEKKKDKKSNLASSPKKNSLIAFPLSTSPKQLAPSGSHIAELKGKLTSKTSKKSVYDDSGVESKRKDFETRARSFSFAASPSSGVNLSRPAVPLNRGRDRASSIDEGSTIGKSTFPSKKRTMGKKKSQEKSSDEKKLKKRTSSDSSSDSDDN